ncbi:MAG: peptidylprolyl isomerase [Saprospiraceae bacterium]
MNLRFLLLLFVGVTIFSINSCVPPEKKDFTKKDIDFNDPTFRKILDFQYKRLPDSILSYISDKNPLYRYAAVSAIGSIGDSSKANYITNSLHDPEYIVRLAAAHSIGLIGNSSLEDSLINSFGKYDTLYPNTQFNEEILESLGKIADKNTLRLISTVKTYRPSDSLLIIGQVKSIYRFLQRNIWTTEGTDRMESILSSHRYKNKARYYASEYFILINIDEINRHKTSLFNQLKKVNNPILKKNLVLSLGKTADENIMNYYFTMLKDSLLNTEVKQNIFKAFDNFPYEKVKDMAMISCNDSNAIISTAAADFFLRNATPKDIYPLRDIAQNSSDWHTKSTLYQAILKTIPNYYANTKAIIINDVKKLFEQSSNPYEKASYIKAIGYDINSFPLLDELGIKSEIPVVKTTAMESIGNILQNINLSQYSQGSIKYYKSIILPLLLESLSSNDAGLISTTAEALLNSKIDFKEDIVDSGILDKTLQQLKSPSDYEAISNLIKLNTKYGITTTINNKIAYNNPLDWNLFDSLKDTTKINIKTDKGDIVLLLFKKSAPETVTNFIKNINSGAYNDRYFHRVVPNFVIQSGCNRGDGYGAGNFTFRTEQNYMEFDDSGYIGMASSGKDTESMQWFITLGPTPKLDSRYTLFGKVISDKNILWKIMLGDKVEKISIVN